MTVRKHQRRAGNETSSSLDTLQEASPRSACAAPGESVTAISLAATVSEDIENRADGAGAGKDEPTLALDELSGDGTEHARPIVEALRKSPHSQGGQRIGRYELIRSLGRGGMGEVFLARDLRLGRLVALKRLHAPGTGLVERFLREARTTARCTHENIVVIHEVGEHGGYPFMVLEYLEGHTLREWMNARVRRMNEPGPLPPARAVELMLPVVRALSYAHARGVVHRDLKPENVMLTRSGTIKVLDFGIAKLLSVARGEEEPADGVPVDVGEFHSARVSGMMPAYSSARIGTLPYMSPEQMNAGLIDHRSDLWAVGIMLFELVTGRHPMADDSRAQLLRIAELDEPMPSVLEVMPELVLEMRALASIIDRCLIKNRAHRTAKARVLLAELEALATGRRARLTNEHSNPFAGLAAFQETDAGRFFGRDCDINQVVTDLRSRPLVAVVGPSGAGKSSLVRAGMIPRLKQSGEGWDAHVLRPGREPLSALGGLLAALCQDVGEPLEVQGGAGEIVTSDEILLNGTLPAVAFRERLRAEPGAFGALLRSWARRTRRQAVVFVDQFEELYTLGADAEERAVFTACLDGAADDASSPVRVVLALRADFFERLADNRVLLDKVSRSMCFVSPLDRDGLREALTRPLEAAEHSYEDNALVEEMLDVIDGTASALPLLQFAARALWNRRDPKRRQLTRAGYMEMGGMAGALAVHADNVLASMSQAARGQAKAVFLRLVTLARTRAPATMSELRELPGDAETLEAVVARLVDARLLAVEGGRADTDGTVEIVHECLIESWPTLSTWLDESREDAAFRARLRAAARQWCENGRREGLLWRGEPAREAALWRARYGRELPKTERAYLSAVLALERRQRRWGLVVCTAVFATVLVLLGAALTMDRLRSNSHEARAQASYAEDRAEIAKKQRTLAEQRANELALKKRELDDSLEATERARRAAEDARATAERAKDAEARARRSTEAALRKAELARRHAETVSGRLREAEAELRTALDRAEQSAERERELRERLEDVIRRALGADLDEHIPGMGSQSEETI
ncbi:serine/threonine-protein kinase [Haliangium ochraceum]|uniref:Serine/threonine protein kinase n=1 Tax=Haliangium ochraceum (strain DSM 14365 / JCM 11303 / SMP-2) TaxID=502025 RepID=D0LUT6_HALO1|nr:serine/threonine-protein kinase [Haliangium ochraceum]ACY13976.1 serine/threonine protein kinase [Haliangium ochraceum DSM 14365]